MSEDAECSMRSGARETWMSRPWVGKGEWGGAKTDKISCVSWLSHTPKCVKVWGQAQQRETSPANRPTEPLPKRQLWCVSCPIHRLQTPWAASTQPCGTWARALHSQLTQPLGKLGSEISNISDFCISFSKTRTKHVLLHFPNFLHLLRFGVRILLQALTLIIFLAQPLLQLGVHVLKLILP